MGDVQDPSPRLRPRHRRRHLRRTQGSCRRGSRTTSPRKAPVAIHFGEGINHYFHATLHNRAMLPLLLAGSIGIPGAGATPGPATTRARCSKARPGPARAWAVYVKEDPFNQSSTLRPVTNENIGEYSYGEEMSYWGMGDRPFIVDTPGAGRKVFTGKTHMPSPNQDDVVQQRQSAQPSKMDLPPSHQRQSQD